MYDNGLGGDTRLNNLPGMFKLLSASLGKRVEVGEDTIGGCSLWSVAAARAHTSPPHAPSPLWPGAAVPVPSCAILHWPIFHRSDLSHRIGAGCTVRASTWTRSCWPVATPPLGSGS